MLSACTPPRARDPGDAQPGGRAEHGRGARSRSRPALAARPDTPQDLRSAIADIEVYLADRVPPLMVTDAVSIFTSAPSRARPPRSGTGRDARWPWGATDLASSSCCTTRCTSSPCGRARPRAKDPLLVFLRSVGEDLAAACSPTEREQLRRALLHLGDPTWCAPTRSSWRRGSCRSQSWRRPCLTHFSRCM